MLGAPVVLITVSYWLLRRWGLRHSIALVFSSIPLLAIVTWPLSGLFVLSANCSDMPNLQVHLSKRQSIDSLLVIGPGMHWLNSQLDVERRIWNDSNHFYREEIARKGMPHIRATKSELRSQYEIDIGFPKPTGFKERYLTSAPIVIKELGAEIPIAQVNELAWGGGLIGHYVGLFADFSPFNSMHLSCGFAGSGIGVWRGNSRNRYDSYEQAERSLFDQVFSLRR